MRVGWMDKLLIELRKMCLSCDMSDTSDTIEQIGFENLYNHIQPDNSRREVYMEEFDSGKQCKIDLHIPRADGKNWWFVVGADHYYESTSHPDSIATSDEWLIQDSNYEVDPPYVVFARDLDAKEMRFEWINRAEKIYSVNFVSSAPDLAVVGGFWGVYKTQNLHRFHIHVPVDTSKPWWFTVALEPSRDIGPTRACPMLPSSGGSVSGADDRYESTQHPANINISDVWGMTEFSNDPAKIVLTRQSDSAEMRFIRN